MMFKKLRSTIESRRNSKNLFWKSLVWTKDIIWQLWAWVDNYIKKRHSNKQFRQPFTEILNTAPLKSNPQAQTEIHSLVCHQHVYMYLLAIKSFLRFYDDVAVVVHTDGSLNRRDKKTLQFHIKNINIIEKNIKNKIINQALKNKSSSQTYRTDWPNGKQLFDFALLSKTGKIVALDPDVLFLSRPNELINWIIDGEKAIRYLYTENPATQQAVFSQLEYGQQMDFCCGLLCFYKEVVDLVLIEKLLVKIKKPDWATGQNIYAILFKEQSDSYKMSYFNSDKYQSPADPNSFVFMPDPAIFRHYFSSLGLRDQYIIDAKKVMDSLI